MAFVGHKRSGKKRLVRGLAESCEADDVEWLKRTEVRGERGRGKREERGERHTHGGMRDRHTHTHRERMRDTGGGG